MCQHFGHKLLVARREAGTSITFSAGVCQLAAKPDLLILQASADDAATLETLEDVVARHLKRFAFREDLDVNWIRAGMSK
jgi:uncharacterized protein